MKNAQARLLLSKCFICPIGCGEKFIINIKCMLMLCNWLCSSKLRTHSQSHKFDKKWEKNRLNIKLQRFTAFCIFFDDPICLLHSLNTGAALESNEWMSLFGNHVSDIRGHSRNQPKGGRNSSQRYTSTRFSGNFSHSTLKKSPKAS